MSNSQAAPGIVGPFAGLDVPWLLRMRAETRRDHPFLIWAPFDAPARIWNYGEFHERVGALAAGLVARGIKPGEYVLIHLDNCIEAMLAWFACVELGAIAVTTNTRSAPAEMEYFAESLRRGGRDHPAGLCRDDFGALPEFALDRGDFARCGGSTGAGLQSPAQRQFRGAVRRQRRPAAPRHRSAGRLQRAIHLRHHVAPEGGAVDPRQCAVGRQDQRRPPGFARRRRAPDLSAAVPHQRAGLFDAGEPVGRRNLRDPAAVLREPVLGRGAAARLHLDLDDPVLHEGAARTRDSRRTTSSGCGAPRSTTRRRSPPSASR